MSPEEPICITFACYTTEPSTCRLVVVISYTPHSLRGYILCCQQINIWWYIIYIIECIWLWKSMHWLWKMCVQLKYCMPPSLGTRVNLSQNIPEQLKYLQQIVLSVSKKNQQSIENILCLIQWFSLEINDCHLSCLLWMEYYELSLLMFSWNCFFDQVLYQWLSLIHSYFY